MNGAQKIFAFAHAKIGDEPLAQQVELYRALAEVAATPEEAAELRKRADDCADIVRRHRLRQLDLEF